MLDIRYVAGLFDGEGWVRADDSKKTQKGHTRRSYQMVVGIAMTERPLIEMLHAKFGGNFSVRKHPSPTHRPCFSWTAASNIALAFLRQVEPHLIVKKEQARLAILLQEHVLANKHIMNGYGKTAEMRAPLYAYRAELADQIKALKRPIFSSGR